MTFDIFISIYVNDDEWNNIKHKNIAIHSLCFAQENSGHTAYTICQFISQYTVINNLYKQ